MFSYFSVLCKLAFSHFNRNVLVGFEKLDGRYYGKFPFEFFPCYFHIWWLGNDVSKTINFGVSATERHLMRVGDE